MYACMHRTVPLGCDGKYTAGWEAGYPRRYAEWAGLISPQAAAAEPVVGG